MRFAEEKAEVLEEDGKENGEAALTKKAKKKKDKSKTAAPVLEAKKDTTETEPEAETEPEEGSEPKVLDPAEVPVLFYTQDKSRPETFMLVFWSFSGSA